MPGTGAPASVHQCYRTRQARGLFFTLFQEDTCGLCISSQVLSCLGASALPEQLLQLIKAKAEEQCSKEKGFWKALG